MWWWDFVIDSIHTLVKNGITWASLLGILVLLLKNKRIKKHIQKHLPIFKDQEDDRLDIIIAQQNEILKRLGGDPWESAKQSEAWTPHSAQRKRSFSISSWAPCITARIAGRFTNYQTNGRVGRMKWLKPEFITFVVGAIVVVLNDRFGWGLTPEGVIAFFTTIGGYLLQQGIVDVKRGTDGNFLGLNFSSRKFLFTLIGALFIGLNEAMQLGFGQEVIWSVAAIITGYNAVEGAKDAKSAEAPPTEIHFPYPVGYGLHDERADEQSH